MSEGSRLEVGPSLRGRPDDAPPFVSPTGFHAPIGLATLGHLIVFSPEGKLLRRVEIANSSSLLGDVAFQPGTGKLLVVDFGGKSLGASGLAFDRAESALFVDAAPEAARPRAPARTV